MKKVTILFGLLACWAASGLAVAGGDPAAGKSLTATCAACHGADGNSQSPFPKLAGQGQKYLVKQMQDIRDGARSVPVMVGQLDGKSDQDLENIAAWFASQERTGGQTKPELLKLGARVYRSGVAERHVAACMACHSPTGQGNEPAGFPALAGQHPQYIADQLRAYRKGYEDPSGRTNDGDARIMRTTAFGLSDGEIDAVASYVAGLN
jgi:cytochrome c553